MSAVDTKTPTGAFRLAATGCFPPTHLGAIPDDAPAEPTTAVLAELARLNRGSPAFARAYLRGVMTLSTERGQTLVKRRYPALERWLGEVCGLG